MTNLYTCTLKYLNFRILINSNLNNPLIWLAEFLYPSFEICLRTQEYEIKIEHIVDSARYNEYRNSLFEKRKFLVDSFTMDNKKIRLPVYKVNDETLLFDEASNTIYILKNNKTSFLILNPKDDIFSRKALMRTVRELAINYSRAKSNLIIHGAALAFKDSGIIITGPKGAGKTTLLISLLYNKYYSYIANDRLVINSNNNNYSIVGIPTIINIGKDTLSPFENFEDLISRENSKYWLTTDEKRIASNKIRKADPFGNYTLSPLQFCNLLKIEMCNKSNLSLIIFVNSNKAGNRLSIEKLSSDIAAEKLYQNNFRLDCDGTNSSFFNQNHNNKSISKEKIFSLCNEITSKTTCIDFKLNLKKLDYKYIHNELYNTILSQSN